MYWEKSGPENTAATIEAAVKTARERGIDYVVVASNSGATALKLAGKAPKLVCVTYAHGFGQPGGVSLLPENRSALEQQSVAILSTTHVLSGAERGLSRKFGGIYPVEVIAASLRMLGQGVKVCVEIAVMALDAGFIPYGKPVIAVAGTGNGADTAVIIRPAHAAAILDTFIAEIICKPAGQS
ncbi:hypothetical protein HSX37_18230|uniref:Pyruvate kinase C-terminal domain-containing protein n=1 Tax=Dendrosporobacter quercicolus TaxID=146817 RepID=A0A1G9U9J0_9FIRM|nr:pyruvate kinase alpha/beta domain-containing protein [Dendrosporobacter quercicolus]NSL49958.1 hypothetical protein [Dendrosporobacter quercicolus DSM 1736]SDM56215.1 hypothetical protein SAMN04488502_105227 [Dendrosporobacter quercicolus]